MLKINYLSKVLTGAFFIIIIVAFSSCFRYESIPFVSLKARVGVQSTTVRAGDTVRFSQLSSEVARNFIWEFGDSTLSNEPNPTHIYRNIGIYQVKMKALKADNSTADSVLVAMQVLPKSQKPTTLQTVGAGNTDETATALTSTANGYLMVGRKDVNTILLISLTTNFTVSWAREVRNITNSAGLVQVRDAIEAIDGSLVIVGYVSYNNNQDNDAFIVKFDATGTESWRKIIATTRDEKYNSLAEVNGNYVAFGALENDNGKQILLDNYSDDGTLLFSSTFLSGGSAENIATTIDGGFVVAINYNQAPGLLKINPVGTIEWVSIADFEGEALGVAALSDRNYVLVGRKKLTTNESANSDSTAAFINKLNDVGSVIWQKEFQLYSDSFVDVIENQSKEIVVLGINTNPTSRQDAVLCRYDSKAGNLLRVRFYGGLGQDFASKIILNTDGTYTIAGESESFATNNFRKDAFIAKIVALLE